MGSLRTIYRELFSSSNVINKIWQDRYSAEDNITIKSNYPIKSKLCGTCRSIEMVTTSTFGSYATQLCLITPDYFIFPNSGVPVEVTHELKNRGFNVEHYSKEHDVTAAAFSMMALTLALDKKDVDFEVNTHKMEIVVAFDGSISCYKKKAEESAGFGMFSPTLQLKQTNLDGKVVSVYTENHGSLGIFSTPDSEAYYKYLKEKRRLEVLTIEN